MYLDGEFSAAEGYSTVYEQNVIYGRLHTNNKFKWRLCNRILAIFVLNKTSFRLLTYILSSARIVQRLHNLGSILQQTDAYIYGSVVANRLRVSSKVLKNNFNVAQKF